MKLSYREIMISAMKDNSISTRLSDERIRKEYDKWVKEMKKLDKHI